MQTQPRQIFKNTLALAVARLLEKLCTALISFLIAHQLGAPALGIYSAAVVFLGLIAVAAEMGSTTFLVREIAKDRERTSVYFVHLSTIASLACLPVMGASWAVVPHLGLSRELTASIYIVTCAAAPATLKTIQEAVFVAHQKVEYVTYATLFTAAANAGASLWLLRNGLSAAALVAAFAGTQVLITAIYFVLLNKSVTRIEWVFDWKFARRLVKEVRVFAGSSLLGALLARPEIMMLSLLKSDAQVGFYSAALRLVDVWQVIPETYMRNVFPVLAHAAHVADRETSQRLVRRSVQYLLLVSLPLAAGIFFTAGPIVNLLYGPGFDTSAAVARLLAWYIPLSFSFELLWRLLVARNEQHLMLRAQVITASLRLTMGFALIHYFSAVGAGLSALLITVEHNLLLQWYLRRQGTILHMASSVLRIGPALIAMSLTAWYLAGRWPLWGVVAASACVYAVTVLLTGAAPLPQRHSGDEAQRAEIPEELVRS